MPMREVKARSSEGRRPAVRWSDEERSRVYEQIFHLLHAKTLGYRDLRVVWDRAQRDLNFPDERLRVLTTVEGRRVWSFYVEWLRQKGLKETAHILPREVSVHPNPVAPPALEIVKPDVPVNKRETVPCAAVYPTFDHLIVVIADGDQTGRSRFNQLKSAHPELNVVYVSGLELMDRVGQDEWKSFLDNRGARNVFVAVLVSRFTGINSTSTQSTSDPHLNEELTRWVRLGVRQPLLFKGIAALALWVTQCCHSHEGGARAA